MVIQAFCGWLSVKTYRRTIVNSYDYCARVPSIALNQTLRMLFSNPLEPKVLITQRTVWRIRIYAVRAENGGEATLFEQLGHILKILRIWSR